MRGQQQRGCPAIYCVGGEDGALRNGGFMLELIDNIPIIDWLSIIPVKSQKEK